MAGIYTLDCSNIRLFGMQIQGFDIGCEFHDSEDIVVNYSQFLHCNTAIKARGVKRLQAKGNVEITSENDALFPLDPICYLVRVYLNSLKR